MKWKPLPKTRVADLLGVHRNTVTHLLYRKELKGLTIPDVIEYANKQAIAKEREDIIKAIQKRKF